MKKMKLDQAALKQLLMKHGEKIGAVVFGLWFAWIVWGALSVGKYDKQPGELETAAANTRAQILNSRVNLKQENIVERPNFREDILQASLAKVDPAVYAIGALNPPLFDRKVRRGEPTYFPLEELLVQFNEGPVMFKTDPKVRGQQWVTLLGLVPYEKQKADYVRLFQNAMYKDSKRDVPQYAFFDIQRALAVTDGEPQWEDMDEGAVIVATHDQWENANAKELAPDEALLQRTIEPLPQMPQRQFTLQEVVHPHIIQWMDLKGAGPAAPLPAAGPPVPRPAGAGPGGFGGGFRAPGQAAAVPDPAAQAAPVQAQLQYRMFRFMDFNVKPGETYVYRVRLLLDNPNLNVAPQFLANPKLGAGDHRYTQWSAASNPVQIPGNYDFFAGEVKPPVGLNEPTAEMKGRRFDRASGNRPSIVITKVPRGQLLDAIAGDAGFRSGYSLVDLTGGETLEPTDRTRSPADILIMDADGRLSIHSQFADAASYNQATTKVEEPRRPASQPTRPAGAPDPNDPFGNVLGLPQE